MTRRSHLLFELKVSHCRQYNFQNSNQMTVSSKEFAVGSLCIIENFTQKESGMSLILVEYIDGQQAL